MHRLLPGRSSPALIVAGLALLLATTGSATAASLITSKNVKDNSLTGRDIKNHTLTLRDLSRGSVKSLRGHTGAAGPAGPAGVQGEKGDAGLAGPSALAASSGGTSYAFEVSDNDVIPLGTPADPANIFEIPNFPKGNWLLYVKDGFDRTDLGNGNVKVTCELQAANGPDEAIDESIEIIPANPGDGDDATVNHQLTFTFDGTQPLQLNCFTDQGAVESTGADLIAVKVDKLDGGGFKDVPSFDIP